MLGWYMQNFVLHFNWHHSETFLCHLYYIELKFVSTVNFFLFFFLFFSNLFFTFFCSSQFSFPPLKFIKISIFYFFISDTLYSSTFFPFNQFSPFSYPQSNLITRMNSQIVDANLHIPCRAYKNKQESIVEKCGGKGG